jgi:ADP-ribose pyrophosphatase YjhB (NUDIX family)
MTRWLEWVRSLTAVAQNGVTYTEDPFDRQRFQEIRSIAAEMAAEHDRIDPGALLALFSDEAGHATPKVSVAGAVIENGRVLMVKNIDDGRWSLPSGWAEVGEPPTAAVLKELREEAGLEARVVKLVAVYDRDLRARERFPMHAYRLVFLCERVGEADTSGQDLEVEEVAWMAEQQSFQLSPRTSERELADVFAHSHCLELPTYVD